MKKPHESIFFLYILSSFYFIRCIQNDLFRAFYCKTFLLFYFFFEKKTNKNLIKNTISFIACDPDANVRLYAYRI